MSESIEILIVEDSLTQAMRLRHTLEREGYRVLVARNGREALAMLQSASPTLIISDVMMPEMDGYAFCQALKQDTALSGIPLVLLTTLSNPADVIQALKVGADNFLTKPYDDTILLARIRYITANLELRKSGGADMGVEVYFAGQKHFLNSSRIQLIDLLLSTFENAIQKNAELHSANRQLKAALDNIVILQTNYRQLLETNADAIIVVDQHDVVLYANPAAQALLPGTTDDLVGTTLDFSPTPGECREMAITNRQGALAMVEMRVVETNWDGQRVRLASLREITDHVRLREALQELSLKDTLTGLYNRRGFDLLAEQELKVAARAKSSLFFMFVDLDGMKGINDTLGHQHGDAALVDIATVLTTTFRESDIIARMGGDEFAILGVPPTAVHPDVLINRLLQRIADLDAQGARPYTLAASVGFAQSDSTVPGELAALLARADAAMFEQKRAKGAARTT